jgi:hypothetical protein
MFNKFLLVFIALVHGGLAITWNDYATGTWAYNCDFQYPTIKTESTTGQVTEAASAFNGLYRNRHFV